MAVGQHLLVNIEIGGTWVFIHPKTEAQVMTHGHDSRFGPMALLRRNGTSDMAGVALSESLAVFCSHLSHNQN